MLKTRVGGAGKPRLEISGLVNVFEALERGTFDEIKEYRLGDVKIAVNAVKVAHNIAP